MEGPSGVPVPKAYYSPVSPAGRLLARHPFERVAMAGLGSGRAPPCYRKGLDKRRGPFFCGEKKAGSGVRRKSRFLRGR